MSRTKLTDLDKTIAVIEQKIDDGFKQNTEEHQEIFVLIDKIDQKKAGRWVEKAMVAFITVILTAFLAIILYKSFGFKVI